ncbi:hypothetical protein [Tepidimonas sp.]|uniref:hypothetical protein n=1 Tax=Tepidimonas sp. TaxID=2002775 RepID=UPI0040550DC4
MGSSEGDFDKPMVAVAEGHSAVTSRYSDLQKPDDAAVASIKAFASSAQLFGMPAIHVHGGAIAPGHDQVRALNIAGKFNAVGKRWPPVAASPCAVQGEQDHPTAKAAQAVPWPSTCPPKHDTRFGIVCNKL